jgi:hypothetical protein
MSSTPQGSPRQLPEHPDLRHLKDQAKDLLRAGQAASLANAQLQVARHYGFASWPKLKAQVESLQTVGQLKLAIDSNDVERVRQMMARNPEVHRAPLGYGKNGPLTWVAECREHPGRKQSPGKYSYGLKARESISTPRPDPNVPRRSCRWAEATDNASSPRQVRIRQAPLRSIRSISRISGYIEQPGDSSVSSANTPEDYRNPLSNVSTRAIVSG